MAAGRAIGVEVLVRLHSKTVCAQHFRNAYSYCRRAGKTGGFYAHKFYKSGCILRKFNYEVLAVRARGAKPCKGCDDLSVVDLFRGASGYCADLIKPGKSRGNVALFRKLGGGANKEVAVCRRGNEYALAESTGNLEYRI